MRQARAERREIAGPIGVRRAERGTSGVDQSSRFGSEARHD
jgi:hypothetical protein